MHAAFTAVVLEDVDLSTQSGKVRVPGGVYILNLKRHACGAPDGARLSRINVEEPPIRLTQTQYELLDESRFLERH